MINQFLQLWQTSSQSEKKEIANFVAKEMKGSTPKKRFSPPSVIDVTIYCTERRNSVNPQAFVDFYESKGWMVGKTKMKDWKACVRTWEQRNNGNNQQTSGQRKLSVAERATEARKQWERDNPNA